MKDDVIQRIQVRAHDGNVPCAAAHTVAWETGATPGQIGALVDELGLVITQCQLGLFGYGPKAEGKSKLIRPMPAIPEALRAKLQARAKEGRITCRACWDIANEMDLERLAVGNAADAMGLKIRPCQLGAF
jgi:hypothetical protein